MPAEDINVGDLHVAHVAFSHHSTHLFTNQDNADNKKAPLRIGRVQALARAACPGAAFAFSQVRTLRGGWAGGCVVPGETQQMPDLSPGGPSPRHHDVSS